MTDADLQLARTFDAPRELVFAAWTEPEQVAAWWCPDHFTVPVESVAIDLRVGGRYRLTMVQDGNGAEFPSDYEIVELDPPALLVLRSEPMPEVGMGETLTRIELHEDAGATRMTITSGPFPEGMGDNAKTGWGQALDKLERRLATPAAR